MSGIEYGLGGFGDRRLQKGGPCCMRRWCCSLGRASDGSVEHGRGRCSSRVCYVNVGTSFHASAVLNAGAPHTLLQLASSPSEREP